MQVTIPRNVSHLEASTANAVARITCDLPTAASSTSTLGFMLCVNAFASLGEKWRAFWFTKEPAYTLGIVRIAFGALMAYVTIDLLPSLTQLFGENGPVPSQPTTQFHWIYPYTYGIFQVWTSDTALYVGWAILLLSAVALLVGWHSRTRERTVRRTFRLGLSGPATRG